MRRRNYWYYLPALFIFFGLCFAGIFVSDSPGPIVLVGNKELDSLFKIIIPLSSTFGMLIILVFYYSISVKRWHDLNKPSYWALIGISPSILPLFFGFLGPTIGTDILTSMASMAIGLTQLFSFVMLGFVEGTKGPNKYGPDPKEKPNQKN